MTVRNLLTALQAFQPGVGKHIDHRTDQKTADGIGPGLALERLAQATATFAVYGRSRVLMACRSSMAW